MTRDTADRVPPAAEPAAIHDAGQSVPPSAEPPLIADAREAASRPVVSSRVADSEPILPGVEDRAPLSASSPFASAPLETRERARDTEERAAEAVRHAPPEPPLERPASADLPVQPGAQAPVEPVPSAASAEPAASASAGLPPEAVPPELQDTLTAPSASKTPASAAPVSPPPEHAAPASRPASERIGGASAPISTGGTGRVAPRQLEPGEILNSRYEIVRRIGGGGMGAVYLAKDLNLGGAMRAVKEMVQAHMDEAQHEKAVGDFRRESLLLSSLEHPSIPTIYDYFYDAQAARFYLVMKYISGGDLLARLRAAPGGRLDERTVTDWGMQIADVLDFLHSQKPPIIYRDLKPANVMIDGNTGRIMLIDFGIARWVAPQEQKVTAVGTMGYAPPELFSNKAEPRTDVYSLGATMFHLLTGADPQDNPLLIFDFTKHPRPRQLNPALSNEMERILMRAVEYNPEDRFSSAAEMRDVLAYHLRRLVAGEVSYGPAEQSASGADMVYCGFCRGRIAADDVFCAYCGQKQPLVGSSAPLPRQARVTAKLVVAGTKELDSSFQLAKDSNLVGRSDPHSNIFPEVDLSRFDPHTKVSRKHARIWREGDSFLIEDLGSVNGTLLNDRVRLVKGQPRELVSGDKLRLGETTLHFIIG
jgi:serine/threonine-protein kinase